MQVVAASECLFAFGVDVGSEMVFVWRLVGRESGVAIESVGAVLDLYVGYFGIERHDAFDGLLYTPFELGTGGFVVTFVFLEPFAIVVGCHLSQEF